MANKAKRISLFGQIVMALWVAGWTSYAFLSKNGIPMADIILSGVTIAGAFSPIYLSIMMDKISELKNGRKE
jgi:hypothetical protein